MSASGPGERIASTRDVAIYFREDCRTLRDSLQLEMVVAQYWLRIRDVVSSSGVAVGHVVGPGVVAELEGYGDPLSHAILRSFAQLATGDSADRGADSALRLAERGVGLPEQFADVGRARAVSAWRTTAGAFEGEYMLCAEFEHSRGRRHSIALFVVPRDGGVVKHMGLLGPLSELDEDGPFHPSAMEVVPIPAAGGLMQELFERSYGPGEADSDDYRVPIAAARARSMVPTARTE